MRCTACCCCCCVRFIAAETNGCRGCRNNNYNCQQIDKQTSKRASKQKLSVISIVSFKALPPKGSAFGCLPAYLWSPQKWLLALIFLPSCVVQAEPSLVRPNWVEPTPSFTFHLPFASAAGCKLLLLTRTFSRRTISLLARLEAASVRHASCIANVASSSSAVVVVALLLPHRGLKSISVFYFQQFFIQPQL